MCMTKEYFVTEEYPSSAPYLKTKFQEWFQDTVPADPPFSAEADRSCYKTRKRRVYDWHKLFEAFNFGFGGAISLGALVGFIILLMDNSIYGGVINDWSDQLFVIFMAMVIGFFGGMSLGTFFILHEEKFYKDEL
jgi:hypothetical protein